MDDLAGKHIKGYELKERIAAGGFGAVYRAYQPTIGREVAVKVILPGLANKPDFIRRFEAEAQLIARLENPHIVPLHDYWRDPDGAYLVMRYLRGGSLQDYLQTKGAYQVEEAFHLFSQVAQGLHVAHRNHVVHRDIKPGNILLDEDGNGYLADFGIAKDHTTTNNITEQDSFIGSPEYLSPEQARSGAITPQTDIYSLGVVLYEMLTGEHPFPNLEKIEIIFKHLNDPLPEIPTLDERIRDGINTVIRKATAKDPAERFRDVLEMVQVFRQAAQLDITPTTNLVELLTPREQEVMQLIIGGKSNREIADILVLTEGTVKQYIKAIYRKLKVRSRVQAIARARDLNFVIQKPKTSSTLPTGNLPEPENPYKGLRAFQSADAQDYFGREKLIQKVLNRLQEKDEFQRFLALVGPSGSGKSSLAKAGVIPALWRGDIPGSDKWYIVEMLPGAHTLDELEVSLFQVTADKGMNLREQLERDRRGLVRVANMILPDDSSELLLVIDQFEEVFTLLEDETERLQFLNLIQEAVTDTRSRVRVLVTLRADYYDRPLHYAEFGELIRSRVETVLPLSAEELERAVSAPAIREGVQFEEGLVSRIVSDVHYEPGALPLMQYALTELFEYRDGRRMTLEAYASIGGTGGALAKRADEIYLETDETTQELIRQLFLRLVTLGEGAEDTRRRVNRSELMHVTSEQDIVNEIIDLYASSRLISLDHDPATRQPTVEVAHEAILREWDRLRQWLNESRDEIRLQRQLARMAEDWRNSQEDPSYLAHGSRLEQFEEWATSTPLALTPEEERFLQASIKDYQHRLTLEKVRKERETALEQRAFSRLQALVGVLFVGVVIATGLTIFAFNQSMVAQTERDNAQANFVRAERIRLASQAQIVLDQGEDVRVPALLAIRSLALGYSPEADTALLSAVSRGFSRQVYTGHTDTVMSATFSPDNTNILTTSVDGTARLWDAMSAELLQQFTGHNGMVNNAVFLPDGEHILTNGTDGTVRQWKIATGEEVHRLPDHDSAVWALALSPDGQFLLTSDESGSAYLWEVETAELIRVFTGHNDVVNRAVFSPDSLTIATGSYDRTARVWDIDTGEEIQRFEGHAGCACVVEFSPSGEYLVTGSTDTTVRLWNVETGEELQRFVGHTALIFEVTFSPDGSIVASSSSDHSVRLWDVDSGDELRQLLGHTSVATSVNFSTDGRFAVSSSGDNTARLWDVEYEGEPRTFTHPLATTSPHSFTVLMAMLSADGETIITGNAAGEVQFWDIVTGQVIHELLTENDGLIADIAISPDGKYVVTPGGNDGIARLWDVQTGDELQTYHGHMMPIGAVEFSNDGEWILTGSSDGTARLWETHSGDLLLEFVGHNGPVRSLAFSPDNQQIATGSQDTTARLWDTNNGTMIQQFDGHIGEVRSIIFSPDGQYILTGSEDNTARLWDKQSGVEIITLSGHSLPIRALAFSSDGNLIITGSDDETARVWHVETGEVIRQFIGHSSPLRSVTFSDDNQFVIVGNIEQAYLWRLNLDDVIELACSRLSADFNPNERATYGIVDEEDICTNR